jgi:hypothetical protein
MSGIKRVAVKSPLDAGRTRKIEYCVAEGEGGVEVREELGETGCGRSEVLWAEVRLG